MAMVLDGTPNPGKWRKPALAMAMGAVAGGLGSYALLTLVDSGALGQLGPSRTIAALVSLIYLLIAGFVAFGVLSPRLGGRFLNVEDADELHEQRRMLGWSTLTLAAIGVALLVQALAAPAGMVPGGAALAISLALLALVVIVSIRQRRLTDELMRSLSREASAHAFTLTVLAGGGWAMLAHLDLAPAPAPLDWLTLLAALMLLATFVACGLRGLLATR